MKGFLSLLSISLLALISAIIIMLAKIIITIKHVKTGNFAISSLYGEIPIIVYLLVIVSFGIDLYLFSKFKDN